MTDELAAWVGRTEERREVLDLSRLRGLAATIAPDTEITGGAPVPPGWHWLFFNPLVAMGEVGPDGHPRKGGFLPPVPLPRRMWAGGEITFIEHLRAGLEATRHSEIVAVEQKSGKQGTLVFVTVRHRVAQDSRVAIDELQHIGYRNPVVASGTARPPPAIEEIPGAESWQDAFCADEVILFRYSALTFNGHRIHYDKDYATREEGYPALVVHGPLTATLLMQAVTRHLPQGPRDQPLLRQFTYRGVAPLFVHESVTLAGRREPDGSLALSARKRDGSEVMTARAETRS